MKLIKRFIFLILLINSHFCFSSGSVIPASTSTKTGYAVNKSGFSTAFFSSTSEAAINFCTQGGTATYNTYSAPAATVPTTFNCKVITSSSTVYYTNIAVVSGSMTVYSCSSGTLSDSSGNPSSSGHYCLLPPNCSDKSASHDYILGHGYFIGSSSSVMCSGGCQYSNSGESISWTTLKYNDHAGAMHECSVGVGAGSYFVATGSTCTTDGSYSNNYTTMQSAYNDCFKSFIISDQQYKASQATPVVSGSTPTYEGDGYSSNGNSLDCPYGQSSGQVNGETVSYCLSAPSTTTNSDTVTNTDGSTTTTSETKTTKTNTDGSVTTTTTTTTTTKNPDGTSTTSTSTASNTTGGKSSSGGSGGGSDTTDESTCSQDETGKVSCMDVGDTSGLNSDSLESESKEVSYSVDGRFGSSGGTCPFGAFTFLGHTYNQFEVVCDGVVLFKAIFLTICSIAAAYIVFGFRGGDD